MINVLWKIDLRQRLALQALPKTCLELTERFGIHTPMAKWDTYPSFFSVLPVAQVRGIFRLQKTVCWSNAMCR